MECAYCSDICRLHPSCLTKNGVSPGGPHPHFLDFAPLSPLRGAHLYPHLSDFAPLAPFRGEGLGVRGFALRSDCSNRKRLGTLHFFLNS
jgi:hypothetical protein